MQKRGIPLILLAGVLWLGCDKDALAPSDQIAVEDSTTICKLLRVSAVFPSFPQLDYTIDFRYQSLGRVDSAILTYVDIKIAVKFYYSIDEHPDSLIITHVPPSSSAGYEYRMYFGYDIDRRQTETVMSTGSITHYTYNSHDQLIMRDRDFYLSGVLSHDTIWYVYPNDTTHNFSSTSGRSHTGQLSVPILYTYDNHPIPQKFPMGSPFEVGYQPITDNNVVKAAPPSQPPVGQFVYTYNSAGYPLEQKSALGTNPPKFIYNYACVTIPL